MQVTKSSVIIFFLAIPNMISLTAWPTKKSGGIEWRLKIPSGLKGAEFEKLYVGGMMDPQNEKKLEQFKRLRHQNPRRLGAGAGPTVGLSRKDVVLRLYRRSDKEKYYEIDEDAANPELDIALETIIITHGWMNSGWSWFPMLMKDTLLNERDMNVVVVDWSSVSYGFIYPWTAGYVPEVGRIVGDVVSQVIDRNLINMSTTHFIGHSLGAHVSGFAGKRIYKNLNESLPWITGLDPALPCFNGKPAADRLDQSDAAFVEIIHTCSDYLGFIQPIGHVDYYPNGGSLVQPGCSRFDVGACSHARSFQYYAEALVFKNSFIGYPCSNMVDYAMGNCQDAEAAKKMGKKYPPDSYGKMFLVTRSEAPFHTETNETSEEEKDELMSQVFYKIALGQNNRAKQAEE